MKELQLIDFYDIRNFNREKAEESFFNSKKYIEGAEYFICLEPMVNTQYWNIYQIKDEI